MFKGAGQPHYKKTHVLTYRECYRTIQIALVLCAEVLRYRPWHMDGDWIFVCDTQRIKGRVKTNVAQVGLQEEIAHPKRS